jgi:tetrahydromethanopterin S-methyltransferase subunit B
LEEELSMKVDEKGFDENKVYWKKLSMIGKTCEINNEKFICMDDKLGVISWVNAPMLIEEVEFLRGKIEQLEKTINDKDLEIEDLKYEVRRLIDGHPSKEGYKMMSRIMENG